MVVDPKLVLRNEPLRRGAGKPHLVEQLFRSGGEAVYVSSKHPNGLLPEEYKRWLKSNPSAARWGWRMMRRDMGVYARGAVSHADHATITLPFCHLQGELPLLHVWRPGLSTDGLRERGPQSPAPAKGPPAGVDPAVG